MKRLQQYQCECCGTVYSDKTMAMKCEAFHKMATNVSGQKHYSMGMGNPYPQKLLISFRDGSACRYEFKEKVVK